MSEIKFATAADGSIWEMAEPEPVVALRRGTGRRMTMRELMQLVNVYERLLAKCGVDADEVERQLFS